MKISTSVPAVLLLLFSAMSTQARQGVDAELLPVASFRFEAEKTQMVQGQGTDRGEARSCKGAFPESDVVGNFTAGAVLYQNGCYTDGRFNHRNFRFTAGRLKSEGRAYEAVQVEEAQDRAQRFLASHHYLFFRPGESADYYVYTFDRGILQLLGKVDGAKAGQFVRLPGADLSMLSGSKTYVIAKEPISVLHRLNERTEGAMFASTPWGPLEKRRIEVSGRPFDTEQDYTAGPASHQNNYGINRQLFLLKRGLPAGSGPRIVYQDKQTGQIQLVSLDADLSFLAEKTLTSSEKEILAAACDDEDGNIYLLRIQTGSGDRRSAQIQKFSKEGRLIKAKRYDTDKSGLNVFRYAHTLLKADAVSSMAVTDGMLGVILSRTQHRSSDGLNHQGAIAFTVNTSSLALVKNFGQTSGHSFGNFLITDGDGFAAVDLGDNYPRGVHLHRIGQDRRKGCVVFSFKTEHGQSPTSPAGRRYPVYKEISNSTTYYQWSNDNRTYTELAGLAATDQGYLVAFATEFPDLDNSRTGEKLNDARNLAVVYVKRDFECSNEVPMLFRSKTVTGKFYDFGGRLNYQKNTGVKRLTSFTSLNENVSRPKLLRVGPDKNLVVYEVWSGSAYRTTKILSFDDAGNVDQTFEIGPTLRLNRQDDIYLYNGRLITLSASAEGQSIDVNSITLR